MTIRSEVGAGGSAGSGMEMPDDQGCGRQPLPEEQYKSLLAHLFAECRAWLDEQQRLRAER